MNQRLNTILATPVFRLRESGTGRRQYIDPDDEMIPVGPVLLHERHHHGAASHVAAQAAVVDPRRMLDVTGDNRPVSIVMSQIDDRVPYAVEDRSSITTSRAFRSHAGGRAVASIGMMPSTWMTIMGISVAGWVGRKRLPVSYLPLDRIAARPPPYRLPIFIDSRGNGISLGTPCLRLLDVHRSARRARASRQDDLPGTARLLS